MAKQFRGLYVGATATRYETFEGRKHLVVPVVALVEGVVHAMNAPAPELVPLGEFSRHPSQWDGRPIFLGHPIDEHGAPVSGTQPSVLERSIGKVFNARVDGNRLMMEGWVDVLKAEAQEPGITGRLEALEPEVSVGTYVSMGEDVGEFNGVKYTGSWRDISSNHLAILRPGDEGACSRKMGCGVRAAQLRGERHAMKTEDYYDSMFEAQDADADWLKALRNIPQSERDKLDAGSFAGPHQSFPIVKPEDVAAASHALGRAKGDHGAIKAKIISIAYKKGASFVAQLPDDWKRTKNAGGFLAKLLGLFKDAGVNMDEEGLTLEDLAAYGGRAHLVQQMHDNSVAMGASCKGARAAGEHDCGCGGKKNAATKTHKW